MKEQLLKPGDQNYLTTLSWSALRFARTQLEIERNQAMKYPLNPTLRGKAKRRQIDLQRANAELGIQEVRAEMFRRILPYAAGLFLLASAVCCLGNGVLANQINQLISK